MNHMHATRYAVKTIIILFWLMVIVLFLYAGNATQLFQHGKSINILVWGQVLDKEFLVDFEQETGIHVNLTYFENNEELFVKLRTTTQHDYDLIMPSDWAAQLLIKEGIVKKLDHTKINFLPDIHPALLDRYFDPGNQYTVPYYWTLYGIAINRHYYTQRPPATWGLIFDEALMPPHMCVFEDIRPLSLIAALYLFGSLKELNKDEVDQIKKLLQQQKKHVEIYTDNRSEYVLASGATPVVAGLSGDFLKVMHRFDNFEFLIPQEGAFAIIDSFAIPAASNKDDLIYPFLNYLFKKEIVQLYVDKFEFFPAVQIPVEHDDERFAEFIEPTHELFKNVHFFKNIMSSDALNDILIALKS